MDERGLYEYGQFAYADLNIGVRNEVHWGCHA
jgi:hypothetical protein